MWCHTSKARLVNDYGGKKQYVKNKKCEKMKIIFLVFSIPLIILQENIDSLHVKEMYSKLSAWLSLTIV